MRSKVCSNFQRTASTGKRPERTKPRNRSTLVSRKLRLSAA